MRKLVLVTSLLTLLSPIAWAAPITGTLNLAGAGGVTFGTSSLTFNDSGLGNVTFGNQTGSFAELAACFNCVTFGAPTTTGSTTNVFTFNPLGTGSAAQVYTLTDGVDTSALSLTSTTYFGQDSSGNYSLEGNGILTLTGYDPTMGTFDFTTQGTTTLASFSATSVAVPEPASMALLGVGLFAIGMTRRLRQRG